MRDPLLEHETLRVLRGIPYPVRPLALATEVEIRADRRDLTYSAFMDTLNFLESLGLITQTTDLLNYTRWTITEKGKDALLEVDGVKRANQDESTK